MAVLEKLLLKLPTVPDKPGLDEDGAEIMPGFYGDISQDPAWVTDGHIVLLTSEIDPTLLIFKSSDEWGSRNATSAKIAKFWNEAAARDQVNAGVIGIGAFYRDDDSKKDLAFVRDSQGRVMIINAHKLAFSLRAVRPDRLTVSTAPLNRFSGIFETPLALHSAETLVGLIMPMRFARADFENIYDLDGSVPIPLAEL